MTLDDLSYDPETGIFVWKVSGHGVAAGSIAGSIRRGYRRIMIDYVSVTAHRVAWRKMTGGWPEHEVDHINGIRDDNRWANLRDVTRSMNQHNTPFKPNRVLPGVTAMPSGRFKAAITINGKRTHLGIFTTADEAGKAYLDVKESLRPLSRRGRGEFRGLMPSSPANQVDPVVRPPRARPHRVRRVSFREGSQLA